MSTRLGHVIPYEDHDLAGIEKIRGPARRADLDRSDYLLQWAVHQWVLEGRSLDHGMVRQILSGGNDRADEPEIGPIIETIEEHPDNVPDIRKGDPTEHNTDTGPVEIEEDVKHLQPGGTQIRREDRKFLLYLARNTDMTVGEAALAAIRSWLKAGNKV